MIFLPRGIPVRQKVNPARINLPEAMGKLRSGTFTGYLHFASPQGDGVVLFQEGKLISSVFLELKKSQPIIAYDAIARIFEVSILGHAALNIYRLSTDLVLSLHALLHGRYLLRGAPLVDLHVEKHLQGIKDQSLTCCLRVYSEDRTTLIMYDHGHALGFFCDGLADLTTSVDIEKSVALDPDAKLDLLEVRSTDQLILADLMGSADLGPIWQRARKRLLEERRQREEAAIRSREQTDEKRRQHLLNKFKITAGNHIGKFGVSQVEKAFAVVGPGVGEKDIEAFFSELMKLARLVASRSKVDAMINEMKSQLGN